MTMIPVHTNEINAVLLVRVFLGILFMLQGYDKVFRIGVKQVIEIIHTPLADKGIPNTVSIIGAYFTSYVELICGTFLIVGFIKYYCLYFLGLDLLFAAFAFGIVEPM